MTNSRSLGKLLRLLNTGRKKLLSRRYAAILRMNPSHLGVTGKCHLRVEGASVIGEDLYIRSRNHNQVEISVLKDGCLEIGDHVFINQGARIVTSRKVTIGSNVLIGDEVIILDTDFHGVRNDPPRTAPVRIEDDVWIASRAVILKGVVIGRGSVIGAGAVVRRSVPANSLVSGPPVSVTRINRR